MKRKLFLLLCALLTMIGVQAQETPENDGIYYLYNEEADLFLSRGANWGTRAVAMPVGMPWKVSVSNGAWTLRMYDLTVAGSTSGYGDNGYADNGSPIAFTPSGSAEDGYTLQNGDNYINCPATAGPADLTTTASAWKFLTQAQYTALLASRATTQEAAVATAKGIEIPDGKTLSNVVGDTENWTATLTDDGVPSSSTWTVTGVANRGGAQNWGTYGGEIYQGGGRYTRTITDLEPGIYKISVRGQKRVGTNANCYTMGQAGYPVSDAYLSANGNIIPIKAWYEDCTSNSNPNSTGAFVTIVNNGGYTTEGFTYVGETGTLELAAVSEAYWNIGWFLFNGISYTFYNNEVSDEEAAAIIATAEALESKQMYVNVRDALATAKNTFDGSRTIANYNLLNTAISNANTSIASYAALLTAITNASNNADYTPVFDASTTIYTDAVTAAQAVYDAEEVADCSDAITALTDGIHSAYESDYSVFADDYAYDYSTLLNQDMTQWASTDYVTMTADEHWNGLTGQKYYEQSGAEWGQSSWNHAASETATLPAGHYVMSITARASADVTSTMSVKVGDAEAITVTLPNKGSTGRGIMTNGVGSYADGTYANTNGRGWEYRFIAFDVAEESSVTISINSSTNAKYNWVSIAAPLLKGDVNPNQIKVNQIHSLAATLKGYEGQISAETYATFADDLAAAAAVTVESTNLDELITALQNDIAVAQPEAEAFARGAAMNALISGDNSVVLTDEATRANWTPNPELNTWSTEADNTGMVTPFLQNWLAAGNTLPDNSLTYLPIRGVQKGYYEVSALVRIYAENGDAPSAESATFTVNGTSANLMDGTSFDYNNMKGVYQTVSVRMQIEDELNIGLAYSGVNFNWISWKNLKVTYLFDPATPADYAALNEAINAVSSNVAGFEAGEYAPYNNIEAFAALAAAKAIDQNVINEKIIVTDATTALTSATWTANEEEVNAIYDGTFSNAPVADATAGVNGWSAAVGLRQLVESNVEGSIVTKGMYVWGSNEVTYGETTGYTMPLKANQMYKLTFDRASWSGGSSSHTNITITDPSGDALGTATEDGYAGDWNTTDGTLLSRSVYFVTGSAGDYTLKLSPWGNSVYTNMTLYQTDEPLTFDASNLPSYIPGTYPSVSIDRPITAETWSTLIVPVTMGIPAGWSVKEMSDYDANDGKLSFTDATSIEAGKPYMVKTTDAVASIETSEVEVAALTAGNITSNGLTMKGVYASGVVPVSEENAIRYVVSGSKLHKVTSVVNIKPFRAYFELVAPSSEARDFIILDFDGETAINAIDAAETETEGLKDGKYFIEGKIVIVNNGVKYSANGQILK